MNTHKKNVKIKYAGILDPKQVSLYGTPKDYYGVVYIDGIYPTIGAMYSAHPTKILIKENEYDNSNNRRCIEQI